MQAALPSGIELEYDTFGSSADPTLLLVMGFGSQLIAWDEQFCRHLAERGRHVVRFDNRDVGLSTKLDGQRVDAAAVMMAAMVGADMPPTPYLLTDMAADAIGLLDHLEVQQAHVLGVSMGGMIAQTMAIEYPDRLLSLVSVMSTVGDTEYGAPTDEALGVLLSPPPTTRDEAIDRAAQFTIWASRRYANVERVRQLAAANWDRCNYPAGVARQLAAIFASGDRSEALRSVDVPTLVVHGLDDTLITPSGGRRTAELIPGAHLLEVSDMGHDLPAPLWPLFVNAAIGHGDVAVTRFA